jgi:hypothetical protein
LKAEERRKRVRKAKDIAEGRTIANQSFDQKVWFR